MKKLLHIIFGVVGALMFIQYNNWAEVEPKLTRPVDIDSEDYYEALREYKRFDHPIVFGWYGKQTGAGANMNNQLRGIPDSMDIISLWGGVFSLTETQKDDLKGVRKRKSLRVLYCQRIADIGRSHASASVENDFIIDDAQYNSKDGVMATYQGRYDSYGDTSEKGQEKTIRKYARVTIDSINEYNYDGFDIDFEPNSDYSGNPSGNSDRMHIFLDELSEEFEPKSGAGRILMVDRELQTLSEEPGPLLNYYVVQAYYYRSDERYSGALDGRFDGLLNKFGLVEGEATILSKTVWCEDFKKHKGDGRPEFTTRDGIVTYSPKGVAIYYRPGVDARIGGVGAHHFNLCRPANDYLFVHEVIQVLNPANH